MSSNIVVIDTVEKNNNKILKMVIAFSVMIFRVLTLLCGSTRTIAMRLKNVCLKVQNKQ